MHERLSALSYLVIGSCTLQDRWVQPVATLQALQCGNHRTDLYSDKDQENPYTTRNKPLSGIEKVQRQNGRILMRIARGVMGRIP